MYNEYSEYTYIFVLSKTFINLSYVAVYPTTKAESIKTDYVGCISLLFIDKEDILLKYPYVSLKKV